jgi:hypothetical protein
MAPEWRRMLRQRQTRADRERNGQMRYESGNGRDSMGYGVTYRRLMEANGMHSTCLYPLLPLQGKFSCRCSWAAWLHGMRANEEA